MAPFVNEYHIYMRICCETQKKLITWFDSEHAQSRWAQSDGVVVTDELVGVIVQRRVVVVVSVVQVWYHHFFQPVKYVCF